MENRMVNNETASPEAVKKNIKVMPMVPEDAKKVKKRVEVKSWILLLVIDIIMVGASVFFIINLPKKANELNKLRSDEQKFIESKKVDVTGLEYKPTRDAVDELSAYFPEEAGIIGFIEAVEQLKENGYVKNFSLVGENAVPDKTSALGLPFMIEFEGSWESIDISLREFQELPYLVRAINVEVKIIGENVINFKYGGFLYVSDKLAETR